MLPGRQYFIKSFFKILHRNNVPFLYQLSQQINVRISRVSHV